MRSLGFLSVVAAAGLLGATGRPIPPRVIYPYPIYRSDDPAALDWQASRKPMSSSQAHLELFSAAFSKAVEVGFINVIIRPHEHLVSLLRYYNPPRSSLVPYPQPIKRSLGSFNTSGKRAQSSHNESEGTPEAFRSHDYRRSEDTGNDKDGFESRDYRRHNSDGADARLFRIFSHKLTHQAVRSSTHSTSREHLRKSEPSDHLPSHQPPVHSQE